MPNLKQQVNASGTQAILGLGTLEQIKLNQDGTVEIPNLPAKLDTANAFGVGQTWQNVTASRALGVTYTNTTGRPIEIKASLSMSANDATPGVSINGGEWIPATTPGSINYSGEVGVTIPDGDDYEITISSTGGTITRWWELR